ncbi:Response regulator receiver domain-containing protein [Halomicrobium zhouii]|uniref:Response regulator receiver domain-containing protein n=1 Tax=Halomicrobium zhouii TaxID=767519 RepID=A0A1I6M7I6_9EURY|nr:Response regulator receiver domain-containing protein [Halomicrobium zhouii]
MAVVEDVGQDTDPEGDEVDAPVEVLVVDDEPDLADLVQEFLERADDALVVTTATNARTGLQLVRERSFDAVVSDYHMLTMDGLTFLDRVADTEPAPPGILFSSDDAPELVEAAHDAGVPFVHKRMRSERFDRLASRVRTLAEDRRN